jgi:hypothetical protein
MRTTRGCCSTLMKKRSVAYLCPCYQRRVLRRQIAAAEKHERKHGRYRQSYGERGEDCRDISDAKRSEKASCQPRHREHRDEHQNDGKGGVDDGAAHLQGSSVDHLEGELRIWECSVLAQAPVDIFNVDRRSSKF